MSRVTIGLIGVGEAGLAVGSGLVEEAGARVIAYDARMDEPTSGPDLRAAIAAAGLEPADGPGEVATRARTIFCFVTAPAAEAVARAAAPHLGAEHLYVDGNSASPELMRRVADVVAEHGAAFADAAVMAAVPPHRHRVPILASGNGAPRLAELAVTLGMDVEIISGEPGAASCVKMMRSLLVKGVEALLLQTGRAASRYGVFDRVLDSMDDLPFHDWRVLADYLLGRTAVHGERRGHELQEVATTLRGLSLDPGLAEAGARVLLDAAEGGGLRAIFAEHPPQNRGDILAVLEEHR
ncbi:DUF1932 domain-containing protein [Georgenia sp. 10Sc9-8]|uniref:DUF1932 domain-containing protein n=1 Tax=Georgenia halotolerans TaxID=3028317 RepID=A0ABT5TZP4_9MICO|nr:DUF1932 domain-containing protein [Georgenia halotolerans]